jgi:clan AA aspartic protease (TIGR02281 family)
MGMRIIWMVLVITSILLCEASSLSATVYRWKNGKGQMHYSTSPPTTPVKNLEVKRNNQWYPYSAIRDKPEPDTRKSFQAVVSYSKRNAVIIIPVTLNNKFEKPFAVDTGASYTIISQEVANALNLTPNPSIPPVTLQTANGVVQVPLVNLNSVTVGSLTTHNVAAAIHNLHNSPDIAGLLGLNFLNRFKVTVDSIRNQLTLEPIQPLSDYVARDCVAAREWMSRGQTLNNNSEEEASYYREAISLCPDLVEAYYHLGTVYYHQQDYQRAIEVHLGILRLQPDEPQAHYNLGVLYLLKRNFPQAKSEFQETLRLDPDHQQAREHLEQLKNY